MRERGAVAVPGLLMVVVILVLGAVAGLLFLGVGKSSPSPVTLAIAVLLAVVAFLSLSGLIVLQPNQAAVVTFLGYYLGTVKASGFQWTYPFTERRVVSLRSRTSTARCSR